MATRILHLRISTRIILPDGAKVSTSAVLARMRELVVGNKAGQHSDFEIMDLVASRRRQINEAEPAPILIGTDLLSEPSSFSSGSDKCQS